MIDLIVIAAVDENNGLSKNNKIPWYNTEQAKSDKQFFLNKITNQKVILTKKTALSMGIMTQVNENELWSEVLYKNIKIYVTIINHIDSYRKFLSKEDDSTIYVLGGSSIYLTVLSDLHNDIYQVKKVYLTRITGNYDCDNFFPIHLLNNYQHTILYKTLTISLYTKFKTFDEEYQKLLKLLLLKQTKGDRTGTGTRGVFGYNFTINLLDQFPLLQLKKTSFNMILKELLFFISGDCDTSELSKQGCHIWDANCSKEILQKLNLPYQVGEMGPMYPWQWRHAGAQWQSNLTNLEQNTLPLGIDQLQNLINELKINPNSRRHLLVNWSVGEIDKMVLPPCHVLAQFSVTDDYLDCIVYQRSCDVFLGLPFNVASYATLQHIIASICNYKTRLLTFDLGDTHLYNNHIEQAKLVLDRNIPASKPQLIINHHLFIDDYTLADFQIKDYQAHNNIVASMSV